MSSKSHIRKESLSSEILVSRVYEAEFQKEGTLTAELKQTVDTKSFYPTKSVTTSLQDNIFTIENFGFKEQEFDSRETRVAWISVPLGSTEESVKQQLESFPDAVIYKILSNHPILSEEDKHIIASGEFSMTKDTVADKQAVRYPKEHESAGELIYDNNGKIQYRRTAFSKETKIDEDYRTEDPSKFYASPDLLAEINGTNFIIDDQSI